jgi:hypothetical protein
LNENASGDAPFASSSERRRNPSSTVGIVPADCHHRTTFGPDRRSNHSNRRLNTVEWALRYVYAQRSSMLRQTVRLTMNRASSV